MVAIATPTTIEVSSQQSDISTGTTALEGQHGNNNNTLTMVFGILAVILAAIDIGLAYLHVRHAGPHEELS